ncbi:TPA: citramalate synthase [Candidatus Latescibacteria bacterium]|nr:citramalate synthase [Candidatus Latescibacterota bacterium]
MSNVVQIYDTTLRDGSQAEDIAFSLEDKLLIAQRLDDFGVDYIEGGWPNPTNPKDLEFFRRAKDLTFKNARITSFGSTRRARNKPEDDSTLNTLLESETETVTIFGKSWTLHVTDVLRIDLDENVRMVEDSVAYLRSRDREVIYDAEHFFDGYKADRDYVIRTLKAAEAGGAACVVLCDTNGGTLPLELVDILDDVKSEIDCPFGIHPHNDAGVGVANAVVSVQQGAIQVQGTFNGYGERCGNANLCTIIPNIELKLNKRLKSGENLGQLMDFSRFISEVANVYHDHRQPYVGESAFAHKGGVHVDAMSKAPTSYEHIEPDRVGNQSRFLLSEQSGTATIAAKLDHLLPDVDKRDPRVVSLLGEVKQREHDGYIYEGAEASFDILARKALYGFDDPFKLIGFRTINRKSAEGTAEVEAIVKLDVKGELCHTVAEGDGPVNALDGALRLALESEYPALKSVRLEDYKVRVLGSSDGTAAKVRVLIESSDRHRVWSTIGVSENIIDASWLALVDSLTYKLLIDGVIGGEKETTDDTSEKAIA